MSQSLNSEQKKAVKLIGSPLLIFAGAGSGKTRVLTEKIAHLIEDIGMPPEHILSVTFTNKAANEMKERVQRLITQDISKMTIGTFHSVCAGLLRKHIHLIGYDNNFTIYDQTDSKQLVKTVISDMNLDPKTFQANKYQYLISNLKNKMIFPDDVLLNTDSYIDELLRDVYLNYNKKLKENNATDFDDLLLLPLEIFNTNPSLLEHYQNERFSDAEKLAVHITQDFPKHQFSWKVLGVLFGRSGRTDEALNANQRSVRASLRSMMSGIEGQDSAHLRERFTRRSIHFGWSLRQGI